MNAIRGALPSTYRVSLDVFSRQTVDPRDRELMNGEIEVNWHGYVPPESLGERLADADFGLVALDREFAWPAYPSKLVNYVASALPVIFVGPPLEALKSDLRQFSLGLSVDDDLSAQSLTRVHEQFESGRGRYYAHIESAVNRFAATL